MTPTPDRTERLRALNIAVCDAQDEVDEDIDHGEPVDYEPLERAERELREFLEERE